MTVKKVEIFEISKEEVVRKDINRLSKRIEELKCKGSKSRGALFIYFNCPILDSKEVFEVPEIRAYVKRLYKKHPYFIYFLEDTFGSDYMLLCCLAKVNKIVKKNDEVVDIDISMSDKKKIEIISAVYQNCLYDDETFESLAEKLKVLIYF